MTILTEGTEKLTKGSNKKVWVECDSGINPKCRGTYEKRWNTVVKQRERIGKDLCIYCKNTEENTGRNNPNSKYNFRDDWMREIDTPEKAYFLGWVGSDGHLRDDGAITISLHMKDIDILYKLRDLFDKNIPVNKRTETMYVLNICSTEMMKDIRRHFKLSSSIKSYDIKFPDMDEQLIPFFTRGYFEGDGSLFFTNQRPRVAIASKSTNILLGFQKYFGGNIYKNSENWEINSGVKSLEFLSKIYDRELLDIVLDRKYTKYIECANWKPSISGKYKNIDSVYGNIRFNKCDEKAIFPEIHDFESSGIDLHIIEKRRDIGRNVSLYGTGLKVQPPTGYYFMLVARSSISSSGYSLANGIGIIDKSYIGEILVALRKDDEYAKELELPIRMVQLVLLPLIDSEIEIVDSFEDTDRGSEGFGSSGKM